VDGESDALAQGADLLVPDMALPQRDVPHGNLHAKPRPTEVGHTATAARTTSCRNWKMSETTPRSWCGRRLPDLRPGRMTWCECP
jgi:hypothetical protein